jgi:tetratricopeptide (TPR) repeat protein
MRRFLATALFLALAGLAGSSGLRAQDTIHYWDRKTGKEASPALGNIVEESPAHVVYKPMGAATREVAATDIIDITYDVPGFARLAYRSALADERKIADPSSKEEERKKAFSDALKSYHEILPRLASERSKFAERHVQYKIAHLLARQAEEDPSHLEAALAALTKFEKEHSDGWQISPCANLLAQLQLDKGDIEGARKTYEELAATANIPKEVRQDCELRIIETLIRSKKFAEAQSKIQTVLKSVPANDPQAARASVYLAKCLGASGKLAEAVAQLESTIAKTTDKDLKALAYNALGDCYRSNNKPREALWPYLWVDVIYHQDRQEHAKAMAELAKLFEEQGDTTRAKEYKEKLKREAR